MQPGRAGGPLPHPQRALPFRARKRASPSPGVRRSRWTRSRRLVRHHRDGRSRRRASVPLGRL